MPFSLQFAPAVGRQLRRLDDIARQRVQREFLRLAQDPWHPGVTRLSGGSGLWRARVGAHRIIYSIHREQGVVCVVRVAHRSIVYRDLAGGGDIEESDI